VSEPLTVRDLAAMIDYSLLRPDATDTMLREHCRRAVELGCGVVAVNSVAVPVCAAALKGSEVKICAAVGFPWGQTHPEVKVLEAERAIREGAQEIDFVINIGWLKSGRLLDVANEIREMVQACEGRTCKVILETCYLTDHEKREVVQMAIAAGADFVKTSTGLGPGGATLPDVLLMRSIAQGRIAIKAAGGIRTVDQALAYIDAGATRIGTSQAPSLLAEAREVLPA